MIRRLIHSAIRSSLEELLEPSLAELRSHAARMDVRLDRTDVRLDRIDARLDRIDGRFDSIDARFAGMDARFAAIEGKFDRIDQRFVSIDERFDRMDAKMDAGFRTLTSRLDEFGNQQGQLIRDVEGLKRDSQAMSDIHHRIGRLEDRLLTAPS